jgi:hypothetical protein
MHLPGSRCPRMRNWGARSSDHKPHRPKNTKNPAFSVCTHSHPICHIARTTQRFAGSSLGVLRILRGFGAIEKKGSADKANAFV